MEAKNEVPTNKTPFLFWQSAIDYKLEFDLNELMAYHLNRETFNKQFIGVNLLKEAEAIVANPGLTFQDKKIAIAFIHRWENHGTFSDTLVKSLCMQATMRGARQVFTRQLAINTLKMYEAEFSPEQKWTMLNQLVAANVQNDLVSSLIAACFLEKEAEVFTLLSNHQTQWPNLALAIPKLDSSVRSNFIDSLLSLSEHTRDDSLLPEVELMFAHSSQEQIARLLICYYRAFYTRKWYNVPDPARRNAILTKIARKMTVISDSTFAQISNGPFYHSSQTILLAWQNALSIPQKRTTIDLFCQHLDRVAPKNKIFNHTGKPPFKLIKIYYYESQIVYFLLQNMQYMEEKSIIAIKEKIMATLALPEIFRSKHRKAIECLHLYILSLLNYGITANVLYNELHSHLEYLSQESRQSMSNVLLYLLNENDTKPPSEKVLWYYAKKLLGNQQENKELILRLLEEDKPSSSVLKKVSFYLCNVNTSCKPYQQDKWHKVVTSLGYADAGNYSDALQAATRMVVTLSSEGCHEAFEHALEQNVFAALIPFLVKLDEEQKGRLLQRLVQNSMTPSKDYELLTTIFSPQQVEKLSQKRDCYLFLAKQITSVSPTLFDALLQACKKLLAEDVTSQINHALIDKESQGKCLSENTFLKILVLWQPMLNQQQTQAMISFFLYYLDKINNPFISPCNDIHLIYKFLGKNMHNMPEADIDFALSFITQLLKKGAFNNKGSHFLLEFIATAGYYTPFSRDSLRAHLNQFEEYPAVATTASLLLNDPLCKLQPDSFLSHLVSTFYTPVSSKT